MASNIPSIPKPQTTYNFHIDNSNHPFLHSSLPKSQDLWARPVHPAESFDPVAFTHCPFSPSLAPIEPRPMDCTPFVFVEDVSELRYLASRLEEASEFAVDLEHHSYRTFQGMTCLMQISTRTEDYVVDTLKLRPYIGDLLGKFFLDSNKKKVFHGAINDMVWLQRDFGIYVVNMFDTMQASRVLKLERNSLEFLLNYYCGVVADKQYQRSDWRQRPLPLAMIKYAKEDTHFLLYIYDLMRNKLILGSSLSELGFEDPLAEVYKRSQEVCLKLYKRKVFDPDTSYLYFNGLRKANLDSQQLAVLAGLLEWRDTIAREEDESTGYVLPNKDVLELAKIKPLTLREFHDVLGYSKPIIRRYCNVIMEIIWAAVRNRARKFEMGAQLLKSEIPVSVIASKIQETKDKLSRKEERVISTHRREIEARQTVIYGPRGLPQPRVIWVRPVFTPSGVPVVVQRCWHPTMVSAIQNHHYYANTFN